MSRKLSPKRHPLLSVIAFMLLSSLSVRADVPPSPVAPQTKLSDGELVVAVQGLKVQSGTVVALLFPSDQGFPSKVAQAAQRQAAKVTAESVELRFSHVASGTYAVTVYQDVNDNGKLDTNWIGIPKEPVGVSNNPRPRMGPPRFHDASFTMSESEQKVVVNLIRP